MRGAPGLQCAQGDHYVHDDDYDDDNDNYGDEGLRPLRDKSDVL